MDVGERKAAKGYFLMNPASLVTNPEIRKKNAGPPRFIGAGVIKGIRNRALSYIILLSFPSLILQLT